MSYVINFFGGPGLGKSTLSAGLFYWMKKNYYEVELSTEYAKDVTWEGHQAKLEDQLYITAKQNRKLWRLKGKVDFIITDSPLLLGVQYAKPDYFPNYYANLVHEVFNSYKNINLFIKRTKTYNPNGRNQTLAEAMIIDEHIIKMLGEHNIPYHKINSFTSPEEIVEIIKKETHAVN